MDEGQQDGPRLRQAYEDVLAIHFKGNPIVVLGMMPPVLSCRSRVMASSKRQRVASRLSLPKRIGNTLARSSRERARPLIYPSGQGIRGSWR